MSSVQAGIPVKAPRRRRKSRFKRRQTRVAWLMLLPALLIVGFVAFFPLGRTIYQSFTDEQFLGGTAHWIGLKNYRSLIDDPDFRNSIVVTVKFTLITVAFEF